MLGFSTIYFLHDSNYEVDYDLVLELIRNTLNGIREV